MRRPLVCNGLKAIKPFGEDVPDKKKVKEEEEEVEDPEEGSEEENIIIPQPSATAVSAEIE